VRPFPGDRGYLCGDGSQWPHRFRPRVIFMRSFSNPGSSAPKGCDAPGEKPFLFRRFTRVSQRFLRRVRFPLPLRRLWGLTEFPHFFPPASGCPLLPDELSFPHLSFCCLGTGPFADPLFSPLLPASNTFIQPKRMFFPSRRASQESGLFFFDFTLASSFSPPGSVHPHPKRGGSPHLCVSLFSPSLFSFKGAKLAQLSCHFRGAALSPQCFSTSRTPGDSPPFSCLFP